MSANSASYALHKHTPTHTHTHRHSNCALLHSFVRHIGVHPPYTYAAHSMCTRAYVHISSRSQACASVYIACRLERAVCRPCLRVCVLARRPCGIYQLCRCGRAEGGATDAIIGSAVPSIDAAASAALALWNFRHISRNSGCAPTAKSVQMPAVGRAKYRRGRRQQIKQHRRTRAPPDCRLSMAAERFAAFEVKRLTHAHTYAHARARALTSGNCNSIQMQTNCSACRRPAAVARAARAARLDVRTR